MREPWTEAAQRDQGVGQAQGPPHITHSRASPTGSTWPETKAEDLARPGIASRVRGQATGHTGWLGWVHGHAAPGKGVLTLGAPLSSLFPSAQPAGWGASSDESGGAGGWRKPQDGEHGSGGAELGAWCGLGPTAAAVSVSRGCWNTQISPATLWEPKSEVRVSAGPCALTRLPGRVLPAPASSRRSPGPVPQPSSPRSARHPLSAPIFPLLTSTPACGLRAHPSDLSVT